MDVAGGLVDAERDGASIRYRLNISAVEEALAFLMELAGAGQSATDPLPSQEKPS